jgi:hypothetical protein
MLSIGDYRSDTGLDKWVAELGCTNAPVPRQGIRTALAFFAREMPGLPVPDAADFLGAMDLSKPVQEVTLRPGERVIGFRTATESPFKLFFARRGASPDMLGVNAAGRSPIHYVVRTPVRALESHTAGAKDTWTRPASRQPASVAPRTRAFGVLAGGGAKQLIIPDSYSRLLVEQS